MREEDEVKILCPLPVSLAAAIPGKQRMAAENVAGPLELVAIPKSDHLELENLEKLEKGKYRNAQLNPF